MLQRDKENLEQKLQQMKEEAKESFFEAQKVFRDEYSEISQEIFPLDILGIQSSLRGVFELRYGEILAQGKHPQKHEIFGQSLKQII